MSKAYGTGGWKNGTRRYGFCDLEVYPASQSGAGWYWKAQINGPNNFYHETNGETRSELSAKRAATIAGQTLAGWVRADDWDDFVAWQEARADLELEGTI